ncbi:MAG TPA: hypothetical protein VFG69_19525 [Nannocystaceae bacterium]|nr:hypothetical protein [Nannocystaceae bacterium]
MSIVVYALLEGSDAEAAESELRRDQVGGRLNVAQLHTRAPLDANIMPEGATEFGRNLLIAMVAGGLFMATAGAIAGAIELVLGMTVGMGIALGLVTGLLMGLVGAMQAGTRVAKAPLRALESRITDGRALLLTEVESAEKADRVVDVIERHGALEIGRIGGW